MGFDSPYNTRPIPVQPEPEPGGYSGPTASPGPRARRRWPWILAITVLTLALAGSVTAYAMSNASAREWRTVAEERSDRLADLGKERDDLDAAVKKAKAELETAQKSLGDVTTQFNSANDRLRALADEKAQVSDSEAFLNAAIAKSNEVTTALNTCVTNLQELQGYLVNAARYDETELTRYATDVNGRCDQAKADNDAFNEWLGLQ